MKKVKMQPFSGMTFEEGCEKHLLYCRQRNFSETTIQRDSACYSQFYKFFDPDMPLTFRVYIIIYNQITL